MESPPVVSFIPDRRVTLSRFAVRPPGNGGSLDDYPRLSVESCCRSERVQLGFHQNVGPVRGPYLRDENLYSRVCR